MSLFEDKAVCERVNFYSHHIDPQIPNVSGVLSLANGHTSFAPVPDQTYTLTTVSSTDPNSNNHLQLVGQAGGPSPAVAILDINPNGTVSFPSGQLNMNGHLTIDAAPVVGETNQSTATITLMTDNSNNQFYKWYATNGDGGGLSDGHMQLFSYNNSSNGITQVMDISPQDSSNNETATTIFGTVYAPGRLILSDGSVAGSVSQQYPGVTVSSVIIPQNSAPQTVYAFNIAAFAGKKNINVYIDKFSISSLTTGDSNPVSFSLYLSDTQNGAINNSEACLIYTSPTVGNGVPVSMPSLSFVYSGASSPSGLYLNAVVNSSGGYSAQLNNVAFNASVTAA